MASVTQANQARNAVLRTAELLEQILLQLPPKQLFAVQRVSSYWKATVEQSPRIQTACFLRPINDDKVKCKYDGLGDEYHSLHTGKRITPVWNCLTPCAINLRPWLMLPHELVKSYIETSPDASWKNMFTTQPPSTTLEIDYRYAANKFEPPGAEDHSFLLTNNKGLTFMDIFVALYQGFEENKSEIESVEAKKRNPFRNDIPHWAHCVKFGWGMGGLLQQDSRYMEDKYWEFVAERTDWLLRLDQTDLRNMKIKLHGDIRRTSAVEILRQISSADGEEEEEDGEDGFCEDRPKQKMDRRLMRARMKKMQMRDFFEDGDDE
ncbi:uncharacterized protein MYCFIDRAFT_192817 [Pseudocercospora fijiensis CIRAD86]|uniref:F-box domain-containing protein n=1 Tax=Pseudocercospora fijiensis (strain CIRAD86) TaxID=383855 RepID=N1QA99_PSEFD|nr:uncharacterized protein MYCFIDRAFT_192817 [Pseudocercospora fijiensis CIRAD86]EME88716.1 hypothetical protein MYCFIDRAFT_192817 [Pseudocercospora fijiensis CIRAD86]